MNRCVIVGGADICNYEAVKTYLKPDDYFIFCDSGLKHVQNLNVTPDLIVGDFDSWNMERSQRVKIGTLNHDLNFRNVTELIKDGSELLEHNDSQESGIRTGSADTREDCPEILVIPHEKFDTDTVYGVREGLDRGFDEFLIIGVIGQKLYHTLGNLYILAMLDSMNKKGLIVDDYSDMEMVSRSPGFISDSYAGFSLLNITGTAAGISIEGAKYEYLINDEITCDYQYATSNEVIPGRTAKVTVSKGRLLLIRDRK